jgi:Leucine-rich repeat (LRR) protein
MEGAQQSLTQPRRRAWYRLHISTWLLLSAPAAVLALVNLAGESVVIFRERYPFSPEESICEHGWPCTWLVREGMDDTFESAFALAEDVCYVDRTGMAEDLVVAMALVAMFAAVVEWRRRRRHHVWQFTIGDLLLTVLLAAVPLACIARRREALATVIAAVEGTDWAERLTTETVLPKWLKYKLHDLEFPKWAIWLLAVPHRATFDFPADQASLPVVQAVLDCRPENIVVTVLNQKQSDDGGESPAIDPAALCSLKRLQHLFLERTGDEVLACLDSLTDLRGLEFDDECGPISVDAAARFKRLNKLRTLRASRKCLGDAGIAAVSSLTHLEAMSLIDVCDADISQLANLTRLRFLDLSGNSISDAGLAPLAELTRLETLSLQSLQISGDGLEALKRLRRLRKLSLFGCGLTDDGLAGLRELESLRDLCLYYTPITGPGLVHLARLKSLSSLDLSTTEIRDSGLKNLPDLPRLEALHLIGTRVTQDSLETINRCSALRKLWLINTRATNLRALDLARLPDLTFIDYDGSWVDRSEMVRLWAIRPDMESSRACQRLDLHGQFEYLLNEARKRPSDDDKPIHVFVKGADFGNREVALLGGLSALNTLRLQSTRVNDDGLTGLTEFSRLQEIDLADSPICDAGLDPLSKLPHLKHLDLSYTEVTAHGIARLADFPALEVVGLDPSQVTVSSIADLRRIAALRRVIINRERAPWGKQYRNARDLDEFLVMLRDDLKGIEVSVKEYSSPWHCIEF